MRQGPSRPAPNGNDPLANGIKEQLVKKLRDWDDPVIPESKLSFGSYGCLIRKKMDSTLNLIYDEWHNFLGNKLMVDAVLSRVRHYCHTVTIDGPSLRELQG
jgi:hypothetical protein